MQISDSDSDPESETGGKINPLNSKSWSIQKYYICATVWYCCLWYCGDTPLKFWNACYWCDGLKRAARNEGNIYILFICTRKTKRESSMKDIGHSRASGESTSASRRWQASMLLHAKRGVLATATLKINMLIAFRQPPRRKMTECYLHCHDYLRENCSDVCWAGW